MSHALCYPLSVANGLAIFGAGAAAREIAWLAQQCWGDDVPLTLLVENDAVADAECNGVPVIPLRDFLDAEKKTPVLVAVGDPASREAAANRCMAAGLEFASLVHPRVEASRWVTVGRGTMVCAGTVLTTNISIGEHVYINVGCTISHDARIADFATFSPGVHVAGWVTVGRRVFFGTGAVVKNGSRDRPIVIGDNAVIGAGACVVRDVEANATVVGVPAARRR